LAEIVNSSTNVASALGDIASASHEQANGIEEVAKVVAHMDEMTQRNSMMAEESAAVARQLEQATESLQQLVRNFRTGDAPSPDLASALAAQLRQAAAPAKRHAAPALPLKKAAGGWEEF
jgi:methyl-accepting chemotaxis protein